MEQIISDFKDLLQEREDKLRDLREQDLSTKREEDEIQEDFYTDPRRKTYHDLRKQVKGLEDQETQFMEVQNRVFNI